MCHCFNLKHLRKCFHLLHYDSFGFHIYIQYIFFFLFRDDKSVGNLFVITSAVRKSFEMVVLAVSQKWPVLLYGLAGAGKSALINKLALDSGNQGISFLFLPLLWFNGTPHAYTFWLNPS